MTTRFNSPLILKETATPGATPANGSRWLYFKADGNLYRKNPDGSENLVGGTPNAVTLDTDQTITGAKRFTNTDVPHPPVTVDGAAPAAPQIGDLWVATAAGPATANVNFSVGPVDPNFTGPGMWVQTGLGSDGSGFTFWIEDGT